MAAPQLSIKGRLFDGAELVPATVVVSKGRVARVAGPTAQVNAEVELDFAEGILIPGVVDTHVHFRDPGSQLKEDFGSGTVAAAFGGVTTVVDMPNTLPWVESVEALEVKARAVRGKAAVDFGLSGTVSDLRPKRVRELSEAGVLSIEAFMADVPPERVLDRDPSIRESLEACSREEQVFGAYCASQVEWKRISAEAKASGRDGLEAFREAKSPASEALAASRLCKLNEDVKATVILRQLSCRAALDVVRTFRRDGGRAVVEATPHHLLMTEKDEEGRGFLLKISPPLRGAMDRAAMWEAVGDGTVDIVSSDHSPHTLDEKRAESVWDAPAGFPGVETSLVLMLDQVRRGRLGLDALVRLMSENPAKVFGLYPSRGALVTGSRADIAVVDFGEQKLDADRLHSKCGWTPYEGRRVRGTVRCTVLGGRVVTVGSELVGKGLGNLITRKRTQDL